MALRTLSIISCLVIVSACQPAAVARGDAGDDGPRAPDRPPHQVTPSAPSSAEHIVRDNERIIAENQSIIAALQVYYQTDQKKLRRLSSACENVNGKNLSHDAAVKNFDCIRSAW